MTLKNSFLARLVENAKRRIWLLVVSLLTFVVAIPTCTAMYLSVIAQREILIEQNRVQESMYEFACGMYSGDSGVFFPFVVLFAIASAIQGFSYLYDRNKIDFYHSKPVKAVTRFFSIWTNGILVWLVPYIVGTLIHLVLFAANGILDVTLFSNVWLCLVLALGMYLCMYHLAILALMLTGKLIVTCMVIAVFLLYEGCIRLLTGAYFEYFYQFFYMEEGGTWLIPIFSPMTYWDYYADEVWSAPVTLLWMLVFAVVVLIIAFWCYKKRPSELAGSAMTFQAIKPVIKIGMAVPVGLSAGLVTCGIVNYNPFAKTGAPGFPVFIGVLGLLITCCLIQVIYEADIKAIFHKKIHVLISFVIAMCITLIFRFDLTGFDRRLPDMEDIEYVTMITETGSRYGKGYLDDELTWVTKEEYVNKYMRLTGETANAARNLAEHSIHLYLSEAETNFEKEYEYSHVVFNFHQKNGGVLTREIPVAIREDVSVALIEQIENSKEFVIANEEAMSEELKEVLDKNEFKLQVGWGNNILNQELSEEQARELLALYRLDLMKNNYQIRSSELPVGVFTIYIETPISYGNEFSFMIYPSYANAIHYLEENGFETKEYLPLEDIERICITRYYNEEVDETTYYEEASYSYGYYKEMTVASVEEIASTTKTYTNPTQIQEIMHCSYPICLTWDRWYMDNPVEEDYTIRVYFKENTWEYEEYGYEADFYFLKGQIPEFVKQDIENQANISK